MSTSYYTRLIVGSLLEPSKLRIASSTGALICPSGLPGHGTQGKYCSECGESLEPVVKYIWHAPFVDYANKVANTSESLLFGQWMDSYQGVGFYDVNMYTTIKSKSRFYVLGIPIGEVSSNDYYGQAKPPVVLNISEVQAAMEQIESILHKLDLFKMKPQMYLTMRCSY